MSIFSVFLELRQLFKFALCILLFVRTHYRSIW